MINKMSLNNRCPGLIYNSSHDNNDEEPLRVTVLAGCHVTIVEQFNIIMQLIILTFH